MSTLEHLTTEELIAYARESSGTVTPCGSALLYLADSTENIGHVVGMFFEDETLSKVHCSCRVWNAILNDSRVQSVGRSRSPVEFNQTKNGVTVARLVALPRITFYIQA